jgi:hypothetical protein
LLPLLLLLLLTAEPLPRRLPLRISNLSWSFHQRLLLLLL